jgi:hypothetical protein
VADIMKNPALPDYFRVIDGVSRATPVAAIPSIVEAYEAGEVLYFPELKLDIDHDFWAKVPVDQFAAFKKMMCYVDPERQLAVIKSAFDRNEIPEALTAEISGHMAGLLDQIMPIYYRLFDGYRFNQRRAVWRLNTIRRENLHVDTYREPLPEHFARLFINLDNQPRIWNTGYSIDQMYRKFGSKMPAKAFEGDDLNRFWLDLQTTVYGNSRQMDNEPRHTIFFEPGDVWAVDSRQVAHQIFYGRRAISIDFVVPRDAMRDPGKHYLAMAGRFREELLAHRLAA